MSQNTVFPEEKVAVTVLTNEDASTAAAGLAQQIQSIVISSGDDAGTKAAEPRALAIFTGLQDGKIDRSQLTVLCNDYFTQEALNDFATSLKPFGPPNHFAQVGSARQRGGMTFRRFKADFQGRSLLVTVFEEPDGKLEQYLVIAPN